ncbi:ABC transporter ATP-binding protein [Yinghuangia sp. ASG 101]|uniref:ABC transporter ATP-binding protein n=1 Tax=Yinghuangia sp. ASG 101 TaxID=2896848 RepID=UPI003FCD2BCD
MACHHPVHGKPAFTGLPVAVNAPIAASPGRSDAAAPDTLLLHARDVHVAYGKTPVLQGVSLALRPGACTALVGESGAGKTTLARALAGLEVPARGDLSVHGATVPWPVEARGADVRRDVQYVFQNPYRALNPRLTVRRTLGAVVKHCFATDRAETERRVLAALERVALPPRTADARPRDLSGGERQRVAIARALLAEPAVLICDEITSALDVSVQAGVLDVLAQLRADGLATLFVTHDLGVVRAIADDVAVLHRGRVIELGPADTVLDAPREDYTRTLVAAAPRLAPTPTRTEERKSR